MPVQYEPPKPKKPKKPKKPTAPVGYDPSSLAARQALAQAQTAQSLNLRNRFGYGFASGLGLFDKKNKAFVSLVQQEFRKVGLYKGPVDGVWGRGTEQAYRLYTLPADKIRGYGGLPGVGIGAALRQQQEYQRRMLAAQQRYNAGLQQLERTLKGEDPLTRQQALAQYAASHLVDVGQGAAAKKAGEAARTLSGLQRGREEASAAIEKQRNSLVGKASRALAPAARFAGRVTGIDTVSKNAVVRGLAGTAFKGAMAPQEYLNKILHASQLAAEGKDPYKLQSDPTQLKAALGAAGFRRFVKDPKARAAILATDTPEERQRLHDAGRLFSPGELLSSQAQDALLTVGYGLSRNHEMAGLLKRSHQQGFTGLNFGGHAFSAPLDVGWTLLADPTLAVGKVAKGIRVIDSIQKGLKFVDETPAGASLLDKLAQVSAEAKSIGELQALVKPFRGAIPAEKLLPALRDEGIAKAFMQELATTSTGPLKDAAAQALNVLQAEGLSTAARKSILRATVGVDWKPAVSVSFRATGRAAQGVGWLARNPGLAEDVLAKTPLWTRSVKSSALGFYLQRAVRGKGTPVYLGRTFKTAPKEQVSKYLRRFMGRAEAERAVGLYKQARKRGSYLTRAAQAEVAAQGLPPSALGDAIREDVQSFGQRLADFEKSKVAGLSKPQAKLAQLDEQVLRNRIDKLERLQQGLTAKVQSDAALQKKLRGLGRPTSSLDARLVTDRRRISATVRQLNNYRPALKARGLQLPQDLRKDLDRLDKTVRLAREADEGALKAADTVLQRDLEEWNRLQTYGPTEVAKKNLRDKFGDRAKAFLLASFENIPADSISWESIDDRLEVTRNYLLGLDFSVDQANELAERMALAGGGPSPLRALNGAAAQEGIKAGRDLIHNAIAVFAKQRGLTDDEVKELLGHIKKDGDQWLRENQGLWSLGNKGVELGRTASRKFDQGVERVFNPKGAKKPQLLEQEANSILLPDPALLRRYTSAVVARRGSLLDKSLYAVPAVASSVKTLYLPFHFTFKFLIITANPLRYVMRVAGIEERNRMYMAGGFKRALLPGGFFTRRQNQYMMREEQRGFTNFAGIGIDGTPEELYNRHLRRVDGYGVIEPGTDDHLWATWRQVNNVIAPETSPIASMLLPTLHDDDALALAARADAVEWLKTVDGRYYLAHASDVNTKLRSAEDVVDNWLENARQIIPTKEMALLRNQGLIDFRTLKEHEDWHVPMWGWKTKFGLRSQQGGNPVTQLLGYMTFEQPTLAFNRQPFAFAEYVEEKRALMDSGLDAAEASRLANLHAVKRTNEVLFDSSVKSRFAKSADWLFPFQQAREEQFKVWGKLLKNNPARAVHEAAVAAHVFNAGVSDGTFTKDEHGQYVLKVPGVAPLARAYGAYAPKWVPLKDRAKKVGHLGDILGDASMSFQLKNLWFVNDMWSAVPTFGGPWWTVTSTAWANYFPDSVPKNPILKEWLFNYGQSPFWGRAEVRRMYAAFTGKPAFWEPLGAGDQEEEIKAWNNKFYQELWLRWLKGGSKGPPPTDGDAERLTKDFMFLWAFTNMTSPVSGRPDLPGKHEFDLALEQYKLTENVYHTKTGELLGTAGEVDWAKLLNEKPWLLPFTVPAKRDPLLGNYQNDDGTYDVARFKAEHPKEYAEWKAKGEFAGFETPEGFIAHLKDRRSSLDVTAYAEAVEKASKISAAFRERASFKYLPPAEQAGAYAKWASEHADLTAKANADYHRDLVFDSIMRDPDEAARNRRLRDWQIEYNVSKQRLARLQDDFHRSVTHRDLWREQRPPAEVDELFDTIDNTRGLGYLSAVEFATTKLTPAEAWSFAQRRKAGADSIASFEEAEEVTRAVSKKFGDQLFKVVSYENGMRQEFSKWWGQQLASGEVNLALARVEIDRLYDRIAHLKEQREATYAAANAALAAAKAANTWDPTVGAKFAAAAGLTEQLSKAHAQIVGVKNELYRFIPESDDIHDEMKLQHALDAAPSVQAFKENPNRYGASTLVTDDQRRYYGMPARTQESYVESLKERLLLKKDFNGRYPKDHLYWDWLTDFQKDLLQDSAGVTATQINVWRRQDPESDAKVLKKKGRGWSIKGHDLGHGFGELAFVLEMFKQYSRRGNMAKPATELEEFNRLKNNPVLRQQYLKSHPRLQAWFKAGPMANMPPAVAEVVRFVMTKYGRWEDTDPGGPASWDDVSELGFAKTMLAKYNRRKGDAPATYELWLKMPTGKAKADYLKQHPEIEDWLQAGPMANMPEEYQDVVRDIMERFGEWDARTDPLSLLIEKYYQLPSYAHQAFLEQHPELMAYWRAVRSPHEQVLFDLAQNYFAITEPSMKQEFLKAHPELGEYFANERKRRYEKFLRRVAQYLGSYPETAQAYIENQTRYIREMFERFGERPLVPPTVFKVTTQSRRS